MSKPQRLEFESSSGTSLAAILDQPDSDPEAYALFAHCFTCTKEIKAAHWIGRALAQQGIAMLRFDFAGLGQSKGDFARSNLSTNIADITAAADFLRQRYQAPRLLVGHSLGGTAMLAAAGEVPEARAVATIASPFEPVHIRRYLLSEQTSEELAIRIAGRTFRLHRQFLEDLERHDMAQRISSLSRALLVFHSPEDQIVDIKEAAKIFRAAQHPRSFVSLDGADHLLDRREDAEFVGRLLATWARRYF
jgi:putative redox protein